LRNSESSDSLRPSLYHAASQRYQVPERLARDGSDRDGSANIAIVSRRFSRSDFNCSALAWTASRFTELRDTPTVCGHLRKNFPVLARGNAPQYRSPACAPASSASIPHCCSCDTASHRDQSSSTGACRPGAVSRGSSHHPRHRSRPCAGSSSATPRLDQRAIDGEVFARQARLGQLRHSPEEVFRDGVLQQPLAILGDHYRYPRGVRPCSCPRTSGTAGCNPAAPPTSARCGSSRRSAKQRLQSGMIVGDPENGQLEAQPRFTLRDARYPPAASQIATAKTSVNAGRHRKTYRQEPGHKGGVGGALKEARYRRREDTPGVAELAYQQSVQV
jgi:hypothetical protein